jgi:hypothetical protein
MTRFFAILCLGLLLPAAGAFAETTALDKIATTVATTDLGAQKDCGTEKNRTPCGLIYFHYEVDASGQLSFSVATSPVGEAIATPICQLDWRLTCAKPASANAALDLHAYAVNGQGVAVHGTVFPWADAQKTTMFLPVMVENVDMTARLQSRTMDGVSCYMFGFPALVNEFKLYGRLVSEEARRLALPDACLGTFQKICGDPGSRSDELILASDVTLDPAAQQASGANQQDIKNLCNALGADDGGRRLRVGR